MYSINLPSCSVVLLSIAGSLLPALLTAVKLQVYSVNGLRSSATTLEGGGWG